MQGRGSTFQLCTTKIFQVDPLDCAAPIRLRQDWPVRIWTTWCGSLIRFRKFVVFPACFAYCLILNLTTDKVVFGEPNSWNSWILLLESSCIAA